MTMPRFTAEASLYQTRGQYQTGVQADKFQTITNGPLYPAREMEEEVIIVHGCAPGWTDIGGTCWPDPLTEPLGGGTGGGMPGSGGGGSGSGGSGGLSGYWECRNGCEVAHSRCLDTCEGTVEDPRPSRNCLICDDIYQSCVQACSRNIA
jgi:hypothetical protein